jgi:hypothetical protein
MVIVVNGTLDLSNLTIYVTSITVLQPAVAKVRHCKIFLDP